MDLSLKSYQAPSPEDERRYRRLIEMSSEAVFVHANGLFVEVNTAAARLFGVSHPSFLLGRKVLDFVAPECRGIVLERMGITAIESAETPFIEECFLSAEGDRVPVRVAAIPATYKKRPAVQSIARDISEKKRTEAALKESEENYRLIFENAIEGIFQCTPLGRYIHVNPAMATIFGYESPRVLMEEVTDIGRQLYVNPQLREECRRILEEEGKLSGFEYQARKRGGEVIWVSESCREVRAGDGRLLYYEGFLIDVTDRKLLEERRSVLATVVEQTAEMVTIQDRTGSIFYVNPAFERITGYCRGEVGGRRGQFLRVGKKERMGGLRVHENQPPGEVWEGHIINKKRDGSLFETDATISPVRDHIGEITHYVTVERDVTHELELERQLRQAQKMEAMGTLAGGIAHDFNNILSAIVGYTELALYRLTDEQRVRRQLNEVLKAAERAKELVGQILAFSRQTENERKPVRMSVIIKEALKMLRATIPTTIDIRSRIESKSNVLADPTQIHQILMNLCGNALHAMMTTGGVLTVELLDEVPGPEELTRYPELKASRYVRLSVEDTGHGMESWVVERIFEPYFTTKPFGEGTGLGLSVVHGIVKGHGGVIGVESQPGIGSVFNIYFPAARQAADEPELVGQMDLPLGDERILLVDDEENLVEIGQEMLEYLGYQVTSTTNSRQALEYFEQAPDAYDLVVTDQTMPRMTGAQLTRELLSIRPDLPIIMCTGFSELLDEERAKAAGARGFIMKPLLIEDLARTIRDVLDNC